jgi:parvulin-like peptidyl-prolyl isomerase
VANAFVYYSVTSVDFRMAQVRQEDIENYYGFGPTRDEEAIMDSIRLAHKADEFGINVSDEIVRAWIKDVTGGKLTTEKFQEAVAKVRRMAEGLTPETIFDILRSQLRIQLAGGLAMGRVRSGALQVTPYEAWQLYRRLNEKLGFEVIPVAVADFADKIDDPGDDALRELHRKYAGQLPDRSSPEPGFKEPRKLNLQYASVGLDEFAQAMTDELPITDEDVQKYYESHKELYREKPPEETPTVGPAQVPEKPTIETPKPEENDKEKPTPGKDESDPKKEPPEKPSPGESSAPKQENPDEDIELDDPPAKPGEQSDPAKEPPAQDDAKETQKPDPETTKPDETATPDEKKDEPRYKPVEEVSAEIRDIIRKDKARAELTKRLEQIGRVVSDFGVKVYLRAKDKYDVEKETNPELVFVPPPAPDFSQSAAELGFKFGETGMVGLDEEFVKLPGVGDAMEMRGGRLTGRMVPDVLSAADLYDPMEFRNFKDEYFTVWKIADVPEREPDFGDVRETVLAAHRAIKARELAKEHASKVAESLRNGDGMKKFHEQNPDVKTHEFGPVSLWSNAPTFSMSTMGRPGRVHPTDLPGLEYPTDELRTSTFKLKEGEVTVAANQPENTYYVVLVTKREPALREDFARSKALMEDQVLLEQLEKATRSWLQALRDESKGRKVKAPTGN